MVNEAPTSCSKCGREDESTEKLTACHACKLVKYCSNDCQFAHLPQHKIDCKKRAAESHDEELFKMPPKRDDCPICFLMLPFHNTGSGQIHMACRGKTICTGCSYEHEQHDNSTCPFCRKSQPRTEQQLNVLVNKRLEANDPKAIYQLGCMYVNGNDDSNNIKKNIGKSIELFHRAAELGCAQAYHKLADIYFNGIGVSKDHAKRAVLQEGCYGRMYNFKIESRLL